MDRKFLDMLVCPKTHKPLREATPEELARVNQAIQAGHARNDAGTAVEEPLESGLVPEEGNVIYPVRDGIPVLTTSEGIALEPSQETTDK